MSRIAACAPHGLSIEYQDEGPRGGPVILMIMGLGMQLTAWPRPLIDGLHAHGFRTLRLDNRDAGLSDRIVDRARLDIRAEAMRSMIGLNARSPYTLHDMAGDALGLMNALMIDRAHVVGVSMGGMIGQVLAAESGNRVRSLTSIMSSSGAPRFRFNWTPATRAVLTPPPRSADEESTLDHMEHIWRLIGSPGMQPPPAVLRERLRAELQRAHNPGGTMRQMLAVMASADRRPLLKRINVPTLVMHGEVDPLVPIAAGRDTAANVRGARFVAIPGMGHDLPDPLIPALLRDIATHCSTADAASA